MTDNASEAHAFIPLPLVKLGYGEFDPAKVDPLFYLIEGYLELLGHTRERAQTMVAEYKATQPFTEEFVGHEGPAGMAIYIHYVIAERGSTDEWMHFVDWRRDFTKSEQFATWREALWPGRP